MYLAVAIGATLLIGLFYGWTGRVNGVFFFGRTVSPELRASPEARDITRQYLISVALSFAVASFCGWAAVHAGGGHYISAGPLLECLAFPFIFAAANRRTRELVQRHAESTEPAVPLRQVALLEQPSYWVPGIGSILTPVVASTIAFGAALLIAAHGASLGSGWTALTNSMDGQGYSGILGLATGMLCAGVGTLLTFRTSVRLRTRMAQYTVRSCITMEWIAATLLALTLTCSLSGVVITRTVMKGVMVAAIVIAFAVMSWNQARMKRFAPPAVELGADDRWRWGLFYVDRNDPALFVQSRCGAGYTLNYGRVAAWPISIGLIGYFVGSLLFLGPHSH
jgi:hypothetical protein